MKYFLILLFLISFNSFAGFVAGPKINECNRTVYGDAGSCQSIEGETCFKTPEVEKSFCGVYKIEDVLIDDLSKPIWATRSMVESCASEEDCQLMLTTKVCNEGRTSFYSAEDLEIWCNKITGYEKIVSHKELVVDPVLYNQALVQEQVAKMLEEKIANGRKARETCQKVLDLISDYNQQRSSEETDALSTNFATAKIYLMEGRPGKARYQIELIPVDGILVTEEMKTLVLSMLGDYEAVP